MTDGAVPVWHLDVFARGDGGGNPCPVVPAADGLASEQLHAIAAHYGHETGFVLHDGDGGLRFRYFVPRHEMSMCVHATIAAVTVLVADGRLEGDTAVVRTGSGDCRVTWDDATPPHVTVEQQPPVIGPARELNAEVEGVAGLPAGSVLAPVRSVSVSRAKLIVPVRTAADVHAADPELDRLWELCRRAGTTGAYLFAPHPDGRPEHVVARQFPVDAGYPEDPATGVAAGALAAYLAHQRPPSAPGWQAIEIDQGDAMGRPSIVLASAYADNTGVHRSAVTGQATLREREILDLTTVTG